MRASGGGLCRAYGWWFAHLKRLPTSSNNADFEDLLTIGFDVDSPEGIGVADLSGDGVSDLFYAAEGNWYALYSRPLPPGRSRPDWAQGWSPLRSEAGVPKSPAEPDTAPMGVECATHLEGGAMYTCCDSNGDGEMSHSECLEID